MVESIPNDFIREHARRLLDSLDLSEESTLGLSAREKLVELAEKLLDTVLQTVVRGLLYALLYLVAFLLLNGIFRLVIRALDFTLELPVLRQVNQLGGLLFGAGKGILLVYLGVWFLSRTGLLLTEEIVEHSTLLRLVAAWVGTDGPTAV